MPDKIVIFSGKQFCGKDTLAGMLLKMMPDFKRVAIADIIKLTYAAQKGLTYEEIEQNKPKYRPDLIALGNWGRAQDPDYWLKKILEQKGNIFVTDVRMKHEYEVFKAEGAISIRVEANREIRSARGQLVNEFDATETELHDVQDWDFVVKNETTLEDLRQQAEKIVLKLRV